MDRVLDDALLPLKSASSLIEGTFVDIGGRLESAMEILERLGTTFNRLQLELESDDLQIATRAMAQVAQRIAALADNSDGALEGLRDIAQMAAIVDTRVGQMRKAIKAVDVLAVNAKIAASHISAAGDEFLSFADEIGRALKVAQQNLDDFGQELSQLIASIGNAVTGQTALRRRQADAASSVPRAMSDSLETITRRRSQATSVATVIQRKSTEVSRQIGLAVMALQIGDTTRQRIEHVEYAIGIFKCVLAPSQADRRMPSLSGMAAGQAECLVAIGCGLENAQLLDIAAELDGQVAQILSALKSLSNDARDIAALGKSAYGAGGADAGSFLSGLEENVTRAGDLLADLKTTQSDAESVVQSVLAASKSLAQHMNAIQSLEADIRLMGLNTTLRCGRLGAEGRPLTVIAQELRSCSNVTAAEASLIMENLDAVAGTANRLTDQQRQSQIAEISAISEIMANSVAKLGVVGRVLADALNVLSADSDAVVGLLGQTVAKIDVHHQIGTALRKAADCLGGIAAPAGRDETTLADAKADMMSALATVYTMAREREIHAAWAGTGATVQAAVLSSTRQAAPAEDALADIFF